MDWIRDQCYLGLCYHDHRASVGEAIWLRPRCKTLTQFLLLCSVRIRILVDCVRRLIVFD